MHPLSTKALHTKFELLEYQMRSKYTFSAAGEHFFHSYLRRPKYFFLTLRGVGRGGGFSPILPPCPQPWLHTSSINSPLITLPSSSAVLIFFDLAYCNRELLTIGGPLDNRSPIDEVSSGIECLDIRASHCCSLSECTNWIYCIHLCIYFKATHY